MRRFYLIAVAALFAVMIPLTAMAVDLKFGTFVWQSWIYSPGIASYGSTNLVGDFDEDHINGDGRFFWYYRITSTVTMKASDDLKAIYQFDTSVNTMGTASAHGLGFGAYANTESNNWRTRQMYFDFRIPSTQIRAKVGVMPQGENNQFITAGFTPAVKLTMPVGQGKLELKYVQIDNPSAYQVIFPEGTTSRKTDDAWFLSGHYSMPLSKNVTIRPGVFFAQGDDANPSVWQGTNILWIGGRVKGKSKMGANALNFDSELWYATGETGTQSGGTPEDISGFLAYGKVSMAMGTMTPEFMVLYTSGDEDAKTLGTAGHDRGIFPNINAYTTLTPIFFNGFVKYAASLAYSPSGSQNTSPFGPAVPVVANGITMIKGGVKFKPRKNLTLFPYAAWFQSTEDWAGYTIPGTEALIPLTDTDTDMGMEYGVEIDYRPYGNLRSNTVVGGFAPGDFYKNTDGSTDDPDNAFVFYSTLAFFF